VRRALRGQVVRRDDYAAQERRDPRDHGARMTIGLNRTWSQRRRTSESVTRATDRGDPGGRPSHLASRLRRALGGTTPLPRHWLPPRKASAGPRSRSMDTKSARPH
jgi:hypothetical protein